MISKKTVRILRTVLFVILVADDLFGIFIENVNTGGINSDLDNIASFCSGLRRNAGNEVGFFADVKVKIDFWLKIRYNFL